MISLPLFAGDPSFISVDITRSRHAQDTLDLPSSLHSPPFQVSLLNPRAGETLMTGAWAEEDLGQWLSSESWTDGAMPITHGIQELNKMGPKFHCYLNYLYYPHLPFSFSSPDCLIPRLTTTQQNTTQQMSIS